MLRLMLFRAWSQLIVHLKEGWRSWNWLGCASFSSSKGTLRADSLIRRRRRRFLPGLAVVGGLISELLDGWEAREVEDGYEELLCHLNVLRRQYSQSLGSAARNSMLWASYSRPSWHTKHVSLWNGTVMEPVLRASCDVGVSDPTRGEATSALLVDTRREARKEEDVNAVLIVARMGRTLAASNSDPTSMSTFPSSFARPSPLVKGERWSPSRGVGVTLDRTGKGMDATRSLHTGHCVCMRSQDSRHCQ